MWKLLTVSNQRVADNIFAISVLDSVSCSGSPWDEISFPGVSVPSHFPLGALHEQTNITHYSKYHTLAAPRVSILIAFSVESAAI